jgi:hypothetical protein
MQLRLDNHAYSPALVQHAITAAARLSSFEDAAFAVDPDEKTISGRHIRNLVQEVGSDMAKARDRLGEDQVHHRLRPRVEITPDAVAVELDGGRTRTREAPSKPGVHQAQNQEDKIACLVTLQSQVVEEDPQPQLPISFLQARRVQRLVQQMQGQAAEGDCPAEASPDAPSEEALPAVAEPDDPQRWSPVRLVRTCLASMASSHEFGKMMAGEAGTRDFYRAARRAFVADGLGYNWAIQEAFFPEFEPIVDFLHVVCYLYKAAHALGAAAGGSGWELYARWAQWSWQGRGVEVLAELQACQERVGFPPGKKEDLAATDVRRVVWEGVSYLSNNVRRMNYPHYRKQGLPTTSSLVESLVGEFNSRVKSKQKHWNRSTDGTGAEAILQIRAAYLSQDGRLERYFANRPGCHYRRRP